MARPVWHEHGGGHDGQYGCCNRWRCELRGWSKDETARCCHSHSGWLRDLTAEGVESNPGPCHGPPDGSPCADGCIRYVESPHDADTCKCGHKEVRHDASSQAASATSTPTCSVRNCTNPPVERRRMCAKHALQNRISRAEQRRKDKAKVGSSANNHKQTNKRKRSLTRRQSHNGTAVQGYGATASAAAAAAGAHGSVGTMHGYPASSHHSSDDDHSDDRSNDTNHDSSEDDGVSDNSSLVRAKEPPSRDISHKEDERLFWEARNEMRQRAEGQSPKRRRRQGTTTSTKVQRFETPRAKSTKRPSLQRPPATQNSPLTNSSNHYQHSGTASTFNPNSSVCTYSPKEAEAKGPPSTVQHSPQMSYRFVQLDSEEYNLRFCIGCTKPCPVSLDPSQSQRHYDDGNRQFSWCEQSQCASIARRKWEYFQQHPIEEELVASCSTVVPRTPYVQSPRSLVAQLMPQVPCMLCHRFVEWAMFSHGNRKEVSNFFEGHGIVNADIASCLNPECNRFVSNLSMHWRLRRLREGESEQTKILLQILPAVIQAHSTWLQRLNDDMDKEDEIESSTDEDEVQDDENEDEDHDPFSVDIPCSPMETVKEHHLPIWIIPNQEDAIHHFNELRDQALRSRIRRDTGGGALR